MGTHAVQRGATAETVGANVKRLRSERNLGLRALSKKLGDGDTGRPLLRHGAIDQIEKGTRRVDVDDLVALAIALDVSPITLLMPADTPIGAKDPTKMVTTTGMDTKVSAERLWAWLVGEASVTSLSDFALVVNSQPQWKQTLWIKDETRRAKPDGHN
jgi:transcriptional regulator with XRE-family HTH domain